MGLSPASKGLIGRLNCFGSEVVFVWNTLLLPIGYHLLVFALSVKALYIAIVIFTLISIVTYIHYWLVYYLSIILITIMNGITIGSDNILNCKSLKVWQSKI